MNELAYDKEDLNQLLKRHTGQDPDCGCNCPYTGHSIIMLIQFIGIENNFPEWLVSNAEKLYKKIANKECIVGDRKITAAAIVYLVYLLQGENIPVNSKRLSQERLAKMFCVTEVGLRNRYKHIYNFFGFTKPFWDEFRVSLPQFGYGSSEIIEKDIKFLRMNLSEGEKIVYESIVKNDMPTKDISLIADVPSQMKLTILRRLESRGFVERRKGSRGNLWSKKKI